MEYVVLVDENDFEIGILEKQQAHVDGILHRAISVFVFNSNKHLLLQKRAKHKYHSGGLWTNTCCSHPFFAENVKDAAKRRLYEEMQINCELNEVFSFVYKSEFSNKLTEYEYDHVFFGNCNDLPVPNIDEVEDWMYVSIEQLIIDIEKNPCNYTEWLKICLPQIKLHLEYL